MFDLKKLRGANSKMDSQSTESTTNVYDLLGFPNSGLLTQIDHILFVVIFVGFFVLRKVISGKAFYPEKELYSKIIHTLSRRMLGTGEFAVDNKFVRIFQSGLYYSALLLIFIVGYVLLSLSLIHI